MTDDNLDEPNLSGLDPDTEPTAQEAIVAPYFAGDRSVGARWLSPIYNRFQVEAPSNRPQGKKG